LAGWRTSGLYACRVGRRAASWTVAAPWGGRPLSFPEETVLDGGRSSQGARAPPSHGRQVRSSRSAPILPGTSIFLRRMRRLASDPLRRIGSLATTTPWREPFGRGFGRSGTAAGVAAFGRAHEIRAGSGAQQRSDANDLRRTASYRAWQPERADELYAYIARLAVPSRTHFCGCRHVDR
jgi:hypothetical protein